MDNSFKKNNSFEKRKIESGKIIEKHPNKIPVVINKYSKCKDLEDLDKKKFLIPDSLVVGNITTIIKKRLNLSPEKSIFLYCDDNSICPTSSTMSTVYKQSKNEDGFLYLYYVGENTFG